MFCCYSLFGVFQLRKMSDASSERAESSWITVCIMSHKKSDNVKTAFLQFFNASVNSQGPSKASPTTHLKGKEVYENC